jgi:hypothetical protein
LKLLVWKPTKTTYPIVNNTFSRLKQVAKPGFSTSGKKVKAILELIHSNVYGPMQMATFGGAKYFMTFIDDYFKFITIYCLKYKSKFLKILKYSKPWWKIKL